MKSGESRPAIFFDRDGVVNRRRVDDYVRTLDDFEFLPEIFEVLPRVRDEGYLAVVVTNQRGIARGLMTENALHEIHRSMQQELVATTGTAFDAIYYCPHERDAGCNCRKPLPGMLLDAARDLDIDMASSWLIGDSESDVEAGIAAGCRTVLIAHDVATRSAAQQIVTSLREAWHYIVGQRAPSAPVSDQPDM
jgi:D-glycero-D-manno-heptose 1,7-bisphosphate phosphatase